MASRKTNDLDYSATEAHPHGSPQPMAPLAQLGAPDVRSEQKVHRFRQAQLAQGILGS